MKIGVTGAKGMVGTELVSRGCIPIQSDILEKDSLCAEIENDNDNFDLVIHCAAMTAVDECERNNSKAFEINVRGTKNVVTVCNDLEIPILFISSDHIFSGKERQKGGWTERSLPSPVNYYGFTKFAAEAFITSFARQYIIVRSSKLFSFKTISDTVSKLANEDLDVNNLYERSFLHVSHFVDALMSVSLLRRNKVYHIAGIKIATEYALIRDYLQFMGMKNELEHLHARNYLLETLNPDASLAKRPILGGLNVSRSALAGIPIHSYLDGFQYLKGGE
jgi:dTDP-4-dehydrorhamnose reductase